MPRMLMQCWTAIALASFTFIIISSQAAANAQAVYAQPLFGFAWPTHSIPVNIQNVSNPPYARQVVLAAMNTWNAAQEWFIRNFEQGQGPADLFYLTNVSYPNRVNVTFGPLKTDDWGYTYFNYNLDAQGHFTDINITIVLDTAKAWGQTRLQSLAMHELGHALGLAHTDFSYYDLMNHLSPDYGILYPSSLNLYGLYQLSKADSISTLPPNPVLLPSTISYGDYLPPQTSIGSCSTNVRCIVESNSSVTGPGFSQNTAVIHLSSSFQNLSVYVNLTVPKTAIPDINQVRFYVNNTLPLGSSQDVAMNTTHYFIYFIFPYTFPSGTFIELEVRLATSSPTLTSAGLLGIIPPILAVTILLKKRLRAQIDGPSTRGAEANL